MDQSCKPLQASVVINEQTRPSIAQDRLGSGKGEQSFSRHVGPPLSVPCADQGVEGRLESVESAPQGHCGTIRLGQPSLRRESCSRESPTRSARLQESRSRFAVAQEETSESVATYLVVCERGTNRELIFGRSAQQSVTTKSIESGRIESVDDLKSFAFTEVEPGKLEEYRFPRDGVPLVASSLTPDEPGPHFVHCICFDERHAGNLSTNEQIDHHQPTEQFTGSGIGTETLELRKGGSYLVDLGVAEQAHKMVRNGILGEFPESVQDNLLAVDGSNGHHLDGALSGSAEQVPKDVVLVLGGSVRGVDDQHATWRTQLGEESGERVAYCRLKLQDKRWELAEIHAQDLESVGLLLGPSGETE